MISFLIEKLILKDFNNKNNIIEQFEKKKRFSKKAK
jgi:hypothetical protein